MIISLTKLKVMFPNVEEQVLIDKITAIESAIRGYTNNNFQDRKVRFSAAILNNVCTPSHPLIKEGDTVTISQSINEGFYNVESVSENQMILSSELIDTPINLITKVYYPPDVVSVASDLMKWTIEYSEKQLMGISSESISRYSVSYSNLNSDGANINGYPVSIMSRLKAYMKAKF